MLNAMQLVLSKMPSHMTLLDLLLPQLTRALQGEFIYWVDGGAGVGSTGASYAAILDRELDEEIREKSLVACYDPLPENAAVLRDRFAANPRFLIREVALSNKDGEAIFSIPSRISSNSFGPWVPGTSYSGSLQDTSSDQEKLTVKTVCLADESIPRFDFVKLDLQGGELDALKGMSDKLTETKLLYVETQLLHDSGVLSFLAANGFFLLFDRLQFGFNSNTKYLSFEVLSECGITIDRMHLPQSSGLPLICWGHFDSSVDMLDPHAFVLRSSFSKILIDSGVNYLQTDAICVNVNYLKHIIPLAISSK